MAQDISETLKQRGAQYGVFTDNAQNIQNIKRVMHQMENWKKLADDQKEALEMIAVKIGRILSGNPDLYDHWHDIAGYAKLVADRLT